MDKKILISLHDVAPHHLPRLKRAETFLERLNVSSVSYLFIPDYHHSNCHLSQEETDEFFLWCNRDRPYRVHWILHGHSHIQDQISSRKQQIIKDFINRKIRTAGEGEFEALTPEGMLSRIREGSIQFESVLGFKPEGFIAPAWIYGNGLIEILKAEGFQMTENKRHIFWLSSAEKTPAPVITWATRNFFLRILSIIGTPLLYLVWRRKPILRIALHPHDFDHTDTLKSIQFILSKALSHRQHISYQEMDKTKKNEF